MRKPKVAKEPKDAKNLDGSAFSRWLSSKISTGNQSVQEIAKNAGVSVPTIYNIINGRTGNPQSAIKEKIASALQQEIPKAVEKEDSTENQIIGLGELQDFDPYDTKNLPKTSGVYVFYDIARRPLYVGKGTNISSRVKDHADKFWFKSPIVETGAFVEIPDKDLRDQVESVLIRFLKDNAVINKQLVDRKND